MDIKDKEDAKWSIVFADIGVRSDETKKWYRENYDIKGDDASPQWIEAK